MNKYVDIKEKNGVLAVSIFYKGHVSVTIKDSRGDEDYKSKVDINTITFNQKYSTNHYQKYIYTADQKSIADDLYVCTMDQINQMLAGKYENKQFQSLRSYIHDGIQIPRIIERDQDSFVHGNVQEDYIHDGLQGGGNDKKEP